MKEKKDNMEKQNPKISVEKDKKSSKKEELVRKKIIYNINYSQKKI